MADQQQSWASTCGGAPPELNVRRLQVLDNRFVQTPDLRVATERCFLADSRGMRAEKRVGGSRGKFIAAMALYSISNVKLRKLEAVRL